MKSQKKYSLVIDTTGLRCPLPLLKVQKNINSLRKNHEALIITDDPMAEIDLKHFCLNNNYLLKGSSYFLAKSSIFSGGQSGTDIPRFNSIC